MYSMTGKTQGNAEICFFTVRQTVYAELPDIQNMIGTAFSWQTLKSVYYMLLKLTL